MPVKRCTKDGVSGWKYGDSGHCYTGPGAKSKAAKQGQAIEISRHSTANKLLESLNEIIEKEKESDNES